MAEKTKKKENRSGADSASCSDKSCPFHGSLRLRGRQFVGKVISTKAQKTAVVVWQRLCYIPKYERYERKRTRLQVHVPGCLSVSDGDVVKIAECRPISKTKNFSVIEVVKKVEK